MDLHPTQKDPFGIPIARLHFKWGENELAMFAHAKEISAKIFKAAGAEIWANDEKPESPGYSLHETGTCRMGQDPKTSVTNKFGRAHEVENLYLCDASIFPNSTDKTTTLSILAFSLRASENLLGYLNGRKHT